jgi:hypothetical protein
MRSGQAHLGVEGTTPIVTNNAVPRHMIDRAVAVINEVLPQADAGIADCPICVEDHGPDLIDLAGKIDALEVINNATVYGALPRGTYLTYVDSYALRLARQEDSK